MWYKKSGLIFICIIMMFAVGCKREESIKIQDVNLENVVRKMIDKPEGKIYKSDVKDITALDATGKNIKDISGIQNLVNLKTLTLEKNSISNIEPLAQLTNLEELNLDNNDIKDISAIKNITSIKSLSLSSNRIDDISDMKNLTNIEKLDLDSNEIMDLSPLSGMSYINYINLSSNKINNIDKLNNLENLNSLYLANNSITNYSGIKGIYNKIKNKDFKLETETKAVKPKVVIQKEIVVQKQYVTQPQWQVPTYVQQSDYIFDFSDSRLITDYEINNLDYNLREYARNEIYARYGYVFNMAKFRNYFMAKSWYSPNPNFNIDTSMLNSIEKANIEIIKEHE
ncbi:leucine-rich repeat domain-containing protein [Clostridium psychrophilum]|uniref:leucine-rich repeat domain-containing protein n=1 Tax=Clostridium psychrophilum TaxID=132926 RepID=UPI001C0C6F38|nr:leucine-rich repeat domain-containing protein [Clostridium psychrophilum]MBU3181425.1 leucine-rich repeat domain-containing protein [Clostridium psychrophilum]